MSDLFTQRDKRRAAAVLKGVNTGIAQAAGFPVDMLNQAPLLINLLPGKQGMKPFSENPVGGSQMFKDAMAAGNIGTYKDVESIPKDEYGAGILGMLSSEALLSMLPVKKAADVLMAIKKGKKDTLPALTAGGVDLSKRDLFKQAGAAAVSAAMAPSILREAGDIISTPGVARVGKTAVSSSAIIAKSRDLASQISDFMIESLIKKTKKGEKPSTKQLDAKTAEYNKVLDNLLKGKDYDALIKLPKNDLADLYNQKNFSAHKGAGDPLRSKEYGPLLDRVFKDSGIGLDSQGNYKKLIPNDGEPDPRNLLANPSAFDDAFGLKMFPSEKIIKNMFPPNVRYIRPTSLFPSETKKGKQLLIVSCGDKKCPDVGNMKALDRYLGPIFTSIRKAGVPENVDVAILSAKHGLIRADAPIENYNQLMTKEKVNDFLKNNFEVSKIRDTMQGYDNVLVQGGDNYKNVIKSAAGDIPFTEVPKGRGIGDQRSFVAQFLTKERDKYIRPGQTLYRYERPDYSGSSEGAIFYTPDKSYAKLFKGDDSVLKTAQTPKKFLDIRIDKDREKVKPFLESEYKRLKNKSDNYEIVARSDLKFMKQNMDRNDAQGVSGALANLDLIYMKEKGLSKLPVGMSEKKLMDNLGIDAMTIKEAGRDIEEYSVAFRNNPIIEKKAKGGIAGLSDVARDMFKGPKGIGTYESFMVG